MKHLNKLFIMSIFFMMSSAQAGFIPLILLDGDLHQTSTYAEKYVTLGAATHVGGNMQGAAEVSIGSASIVGGLIAGGKTVSTGAASSVAGNITSGTDISTGANSNVSGNIISGTTTKTGNSAKVGGDIEAGEKYTTGTDAEVQGDIREYLAYEEDEFGIRDPLNAKDLTFEAPTVKNKMVQLTALQKMLLELGTTEGYTSIVGETFGITDEYLTSGIYDILNYMTMAGNRTLTLDGENKQGDFLFNIHNYLVFADGAKVELINFTDDSQVIFNVLGDAVDTDGYFQAGADVTIRGFVFARGFVGTGARTDLFGVGNSCGGAMSTEQHFLFGANNTIGAQGCTYGPAVVIVAMPQTLLLFNLGLIGLGAIRIFRVR
jgi:predicted acyltransferase (DUF342 family)